MIARALPVAILLGALGAVALAHAAPARAAAPTAVHAFYDSTRAEATLDRLWVLRLRPGQDLRAALVQFAKDEHIRAGFIVTCAGSLTRATLRLANQEKPRSWDGHFEIVSLTGTLAESGVHLHASVADSTGRALGGHLVDGCVIYTTAEIVIGQAKGLRFEREPDPVTTYRELTIVRDSLATP